MAEQAGAAPPPPALPQRQGLGERPLRRWLIIFGALTVVCFAIGLGDGQLSRLVMPVLGFGEAAAGTLMERALMAVLAGVLLTLNAMVIRLMPLAVQIGVVWVELLLVFLAFFYSFDLSFPYIVERLPILIFTGAFTTIYVSLISIACACVVAMAGALARLSKSGPAFAIATFYISFFRGTPLLLQVYIIYLGLPQIGVTLDPVPSGIIALTLCYGAYMAEIFRAGIQSIPKGQTEAGLSLGLHNWLIMRKIVLPQAIKVIVPPTGNQFIAMLKDSSLVSILGVWELMFLARTQGRAEFKHFEMLITAALIYWAISMVFELIQARIERHYGKSDVR